MSHRYRYSNAIIMFIIMVTIILLCTFIFQTVSSSGHKAKRVVENFYMFEQKGEFSSSWMLFHPLMKEKFQKGPYIQDRAHVFMNHFGVETFTFSLSKPKKISNWKMSKEAPTFKSAYKITVIQTYKSKYGKFNIQQEVFVVKDEGEWRVLWDYN